MALRLSESATQSRSGISDGMMKALVAFGVMSFGADMQRVMAQGDPPANVRQMEVKKSFIPSNEVHDLILKCKSENYRIRAPAYKKIEDGRIDIDGLIVLRNAMKHSDVNLSRCAGALFERHKTPFVPPLFEPYKNKKVVARNSKVDVWMWSDGIAKSFSHPPHFRKFESWNNAHAIERNYTYQPWQHHPRLEDAPKGDVWQQAAQKCAQERLQAAAEYFVGLPDAKKRMEQEFLDIRTMFEEWALADDNWRKNNKVKSQLIPIPKEEERKKQSFLPPTWRERLSTTLSAHLEERLTVHTDVLSDPLPVRPAEISVKAADVGQSKDERELPAGSKA